MSERYYVVSEEELQQLASASAWGVEQCYGGPKSPYNEAEIKAACRAREVEPIGGGMWQLTDWDFQGDLKDE